MVLKQNVANRIFPINNPIEAVGIALFIFFLLAYFVEIPAFFLAILSLLWILYVPFVLGKFVLKIPIKQVQMLAKYLESGELSTILIYWMIGLIIIVAFVFMVFIFGIHVERFVGPAFLILTVFSQFIGINKISSHGTHKIFKVIGISCLVGVSFGLYVRSFSPYPLSPSMDIFTHIFIIKNVLSSSITNAPLVYTPSLDILNALSSSTFGASFLDVFWMGALLLFALFALSVYSLVFWITKSHGYAILATIISLSITEGGFVSNLQFLFPSSFLMAIFPACFYVVDRVQSKLPVNKVQSILTMIILFAGLILIHLQLGVLACLALIFYLIFNYLAQKSRLITFSIRVATLTIVVVVLFLYGGLSNIQFRLALYSSTLFEGTHLYNIPLKLLQLNQWYGDVILISILGLVVLAIVNERRAMVLGFLGAFILYVYFQQIGAIHRIATLERPLLSLSAASLVILPLLILNRRKRSKRSDEFSASVHHDAKELNILSVIPRHPTKWTFAYILVTILILFPIFLVPYDTYIGEYTKKGFPFVNMTEEEVKAANWIESNTPLDSLIYSDPFTVLEMRGLAFRMNIAEIGWNATVANLVRTAMVSNSSADAYKNIISNVGKNVLIVITPRTSAWIRGVGNFSADTAPTDYFVQLPISNFQSFGGYEKFFDKNFFREIYHSKNISIFSPIVTR